MKQHDTRKLNITFTLTSSHTEVSEGEAFTVTLNALGPDVKEGLKIPYRIVGDVRESDYIPSEEYGLFVLDENFTSTVTFKIRSDGFSEEIENFTLILYYYPEISITTVISRNVINVTPIEEPEFGEWQLDRSEHDKDGSLFNYFGAKGNGNITYNSVATFNVSSALVQAMVSDQGYREWEAVKQAVNELTGVTDWVLDPANNRITYYENDSNCTSMQTCSAYPQVYEFSTPQGSKYFANLESGCSALTAPGLNYANYTLYSSHIVNSDVGQCNYRHKDYPDLRNMDTLYQAVKVNNPAYDPEAEREQKSLPLDVVAAQVITNAESSVEITEMMANTFIQAVKDSALNPDETKQIIKYVDILGQWEENKWQLV